MNRSTCAILIAAALVLMASTATFAAGGKAPAFTLKDASGKPFSLAQFQGQKVVLMTFWATWCKPCLLEMPIMEKVHQKYRNKGLEILSINVDSATGQAKARQIVQKNQVTYTVLFDADSKVTALYNPKSAFPYTVLIDRQGDIRFTYEGFNTGDMAILEKEIESALAAS